MGASFQKKLSIVIPALNEEEGIPTVLKNIPHAEINALGYDVEVIVIDNGSTDNTGELARAHGARVIYEPKRGYGNAYHAGFGSVSGDVIVTGDADSTYPIDSIPELLKRFDADGIDFLNTNRLVKLRSESMSRWHVFGNRVLTTLTKFLYGSPFDDSQSGMWLFRAPIWKELDVRSPGMSFSQELKLEAYWKGYICAEVPIDYRARLGTVKLRGIRDAWGNTMHLFGKRLRIRKTLRKHSSVPYSASHYEGRDLEAMADAPHYHRWIYSEFQQFISGTVAEVGAGSGNFSKYLDGAAIKELIVIEPSEEMFPLLSARFRGDSRVRSEQGLFSEVANRYGQVFDSVVYINVLEHIEDDAAELRRVCEVLTPGGHVCVFVPALPFLFSHHDTLVGHYRRYTKGHLRSVIEQAGFEVRRLRYFDVMGILPWLIFIKLLKRPITPGRAALYDTVVVPIMRKIESLIPPPIGKNLLIVGRKR